MSIEEKIDKYLDNINELTTTAKEATINTRKDGKQTLVDIQFDDKKMDAKETNKIRNSLNKALGNPSKHSGEVRGGGSGNFTSSFVDKDPKEALEIIKKALEKRGFTVKTK